MGFLDFGVSVYRKTLKRFRPAHLFMHRIMTSVVIPYLEQRNNFTTLPDDPFWFRLELLTQSHETETTEQIKNAVKSGMTVLDIGAHVGYYTRITADIVGDSGRIVAFEPHPRNHSVLEKNTKHLSNVTRLQVALAAEEGTAQLHDYLMMSASGSLHYDESLRDVQQSQQTDQDFAPRGKDFEPRVYDVRTAPVDALLNELGIDRVDVIKMDIEGAEMGALRGMTRTIQNSPQLTLIMEYNPMGLQAFDNDPEQSLQDILAMGFDRMDVIQEDGTLVDYTNKQDHIHQLTNDLKAHMGVVNLLFRRGF